MWIPGMALHRWRRYVTLSPHTCSCDLFEINQLSIDDTPTQNPTFCNLSVYIYYTAAAPGVNWSHSYLRYLYPCTLQQPEVYSWQLKISNFTDAPDCTEFISPINCYLSWFFTKNNRNDTYLNWLSENKKSLSFYYKCIKVTPRYKWPFRVDIIGAFWLYFALTKIFSLVTWKGLI